MSLNELVYLFIPFDWFYMSSDPSVKTKVYYKLGFSYISVNRVIQ